MAYIYKQFCFSGTEIIRGYLSQNYFALEVILSHCLSNKEKQLLQTKKIDKVPVLTRNLSL